MIEAVFISDLHLNPAQEEITQRFNQFIDWALKNTRSVYILGDFFHVWPGDDGIDEWSQEIAARLYSLKAQGIPLYFMHGNRDFLLGKAFATLAGMEILNEPTVIALNKEHILLAHGDRYCTMDKGHQRFRRLTRNRIFPKLFLRCPYKIRHNLVNKVRQHSQNHHNKPVTQLAIVPSVMLAHMQKLKVKTLIHGHTHQPGLTQYNEKGQLMSQFVLSDWDDTPTLLCYDNANGLYFTLLCGEHYGS